MRTPEQLTALFAQFDEDKDISTDSATINNEQIGETNA
jgi:hypothetical protein